MSFEKALREMIRRELDSQLSPLRKSIVHLERGLSSLEALRDLTGKLEPLLGQRGRAEALKYAQVQAAPTRRGAVPAKAKAPVKAPPQAPAAAPAPRGKAAAVSEQACAVIGCKRPRRSKGYCSAHYQKLRLLIRTGRRPADWKDDAAPQSARDVTLPRGRAAVAAREQQQPEPATPKEPPKPKAWVRKKGSSERVSLH